MNLLNTDDLVELQEKLSEFATYHKNKGGQEAHKIIKNKLVDEVKSQPIDGSKEGLLIKEGYDRAIKQVLTLLHKTYVP